MREYLRYPSLASLVLRITIGVLMLYHGLGKINMGYYGVVKMLESMNIQGWLASGVFLGEVVAPIFLILGLFTRISSILIAITMLVTIFISWDTAFCLNEYNGVNKELNLLYLGGAMACDLLGGGKYSIDRFIFKEKENRSTF